MKLPIILIIIVAIVVMTMVVLSMCLTKQEPFTKQTKDKPESKSDRLYTHLKFVTEVLQRNNIKCWAMYGTLLGAVRQHDIIPYDWDFDFGANVEDVDKILALNPIIKGYGYEFVKPYRPLTQKDIGYNNEETDAENQVWKVSVKVKYMGKSMGDIYFYKRCNDGFMRRYDPVNRTYFWPKATFPAWFIDRLTTVRIRDTSLPAPRDPVILLQHWYGPSWKTPIKAKAQGGQGDPNSDYYGGAKKMELRFLIDHVRKQENGLLLVPQLWNVPVRYIVPKGQIKWANQNEGIIRYAEK